MQTPSTTSGEPAAPRYIVITPTFNHASALGGVLRSLHACDLPIIVVNDGATDDTATVLRTWASEPNANESRLVIEHAMNQGKAAALRTGFGEASRRGFSHAITIDSDGQHDTADLPGLLAASKEHPDALILGARKSEHMHLPLASRIGRVFSNTCIRLESGVQVIDSQSGLRIYPLAMFGEIKGSAGRYGFETEILTLAGWHGVPVIETPIRCIYDLPGGRITHFRIGSDSFVSVGMHLRLMSRALLPGPKRKGTNLSVDNPTGSIPRRLAWWFSPRRMWEMASGDGASRERFAASIGTGMVMATLPLYGVKTVICLWLSDRFRLHPLVVVGTSSLSTPPLGFVFAIASVFAGHFALHGHLLDLDGINPREVGLWTAMKNVLPEWFLGSIIVGAALGLFTYWVTRFVLMRRMT